MLNKNGSNAELDSYFKRVKMSYPRDNIDKHGYILL